ncbi:MAG: EamA family transporter [Nanoarchaeota archaeon]
MAISLTTILLLVIANLIGSYGAIQLKKGAVRFTFNLKAFLQNYNILFGVFLYGIATLIYIVALKTGELSVIYPMVSMAYVFVCLFSVKFLNEKMSKTRWLGVFTIILGITLIGIGS